MNDITALALGIDPQDGRPKVDQIISTLRSRIGSGALRPGSRLPSSRSLAADLKVARGTVTTAYDQLIAEGYLEPRRGAGLFVSADIAAIPSPMSVTERVAGDGSEVARPQPRSEQPLWPGMPDPRLFPHQAWARLVARVARTEPTSLSDQPPPFGDPVLRTAIASHLKDWRGVDAQVEQIVITAGASEALEIALTHLCDPASPIGLETPGYLHLRRWVQNAGHWPAWQPVDDQGATVPPVSGPGLPRAVILTPSHQFPLGGAMPTARRAAFLAWADATDALILEDDYDSEFRYQGRPIPALASLDRRGRTIYIGSFAKVFSAGLHLGYMVVPQRLVGRIATVLAGHGTRASGFAQRPLGRFMLEGDFHRHGRRVRRAYADRRRVLVDALTPVLPPGAWLRDHPAGMQLAMMLPSTMDDEAVCRTLEGAGVHARPLSPHYAPGAPSAPGLLLGFCAFDATAIAAAVGRLASILTDA